MKIGEWIIIPIILGALVIAAIIAIPNEGTVENRIDTDLQTQEEISPEIQEKLDAIEKKVEDAKNIETDYDPTRQREWLTSGPFQIDRSKYLLGEKIFLRIGGLELDDKGQVVFLRPLNYTHYEVYLSLSFDGSKTAAFNYYLQPQLSKLKSYCTIDDFVGEWRVVFRGTDYANLEFEIIDEILPGDEDSYQPVC
ncbi:MAG: hypothetical protein ACQ9CV_06745 [Nitrosopumilus sp.]